MMYKEMRERRFAQQPNGQQATAGRQRGQSLAEFALTMPLLIALLVGIILLAWVGFAYVSVASAARMGARHMVSYPVEAENPAQFPNVDDELTYMVTSTMPFLDWRRAEVTILPHSLDDRVVGGLTPVYVSVQVRYPVNNPVIRIPYVIREGSITLLPPIVLQATSRMRLD
jgi:Flp pilus assembly protein TadG